LIGASRRSKSTSSWSNAKTEIENLNALPLLEKEKKNILFDNAKRLLDIQIIDINPLFTLYKSYVRRNVGQQCENHRL
jgi:hypothetical protein